MRRLCLLCLAAFPLAASAEDAAAPNLDPSAVTAPGLVARMVTAQALFAAGQAQKDALSMLAAAHLAGSVTLVSTEREPEAGDAPVADGEGPPLPPDAVAMAAAARAALDPDETLAVVLAEEEAANRLIPAGSLRSTQAVLAPGAAQDWRLAFDGQAQAEVGIIGAGQAPLRMTVTDAAGTVVCMPQTQKPTAACAFVPRESGYFTLRVENPSEQPASYLLLTN